MSDAKPRPRLESSIAPWRWAACAPRPKLRRLSRSQGPCVSSPHVLHYSAFTDRPEGGNPAGVVLDASGMATADMQALATRLGYSESIFVQPGEAGAFDVRYFSPLDEVPFCGHATIAGAVALAQRDGPGTLRFRTRAGLVEVVTAREDAGIGATLTSVAPHVLPALPPGLLDQALTRLRWSADELDPALPPAIAYAGARHLILAAATRERLARLDYDFAGLKALTQAHELATVALVWRVSEHAFAARNPFPSGGVVEDPATGAAAAAFGAYLRALGAVQAPTDLHIVQGEDMGRPSQLRVHIPAAGPIRVSGRAVPIPAPAQAG
ncbi:PhzF family phenazine biosynthesis isomerase [Pseudoxanthomonas winnipegensis]|nr:PhzF family phenazine biosynthesis isomerase [Pseudoxanthomonas winnipegensis]